MPGSTNLRAAVLISCSRVISHELFSTIQNQGKSVIFPACLWCICERWLMRWQLKLMPDNFSQNLLKHKSSGQGKQINISLFRKSTSLTKNNDWIFYSSKSFFVKCVSSGSSFHVLSNVSFDSSMSQIYDVVQSLQLKPHRFVVILHTTGFFSVAWLVVSCASWCSLCSNPMKKLPIFLFKWSLSSSCAVICKYRSERWTGKTAKW